MLFHSIKSIFFGLGVLLFPLVMSSCGFLGSSGDEISAEDVKDEESLKKFVLAAKKKLEATGNKDFLYEEGRWKKGSIYLFILKQDGFSVVHPAKRELEGQTLLDLEDSQGVKIVRGLIKSANDGGGFFGYLFADPEREGDEHSKISYTVKLDSEKLEEHGLNGAVLGSGFYRRFPPNYN